MALFRNKPLFWKLFFFHLMTVFLVIIIIGYFSYNIFQNQILNLTVNDLQTRLSILKSNIPELQENNYPVIQKLCKHLSFKTHTRFTIIIASGKVICDSSKDPYLMENHRKRPEVISAFKGKPDYIIRYSSTLQRKLVYVSSPITNGGTSVIAVARAAIPLATYKEIISPISINLFFIGFALLIITAIFSFIISRKIVLPLNEMKEQAKNLAKGNFKIIDRYSENNSIEITSLAKSMNKISIELKNKFDTIIRQQKEKEAVFSSMVEGVLTIDTDLKIKYLNHAVSTIFNINPENAVGKHIYEIFRIPVLHRLIEQARIELKPIEGEIVVSKNNRNIYLQTHITAINGLDKNMIGILIVFNDTTEIRVFENHRKDFASNVSHELRTPLTSIQGFIETLLNGALKNEQKAEQFLNIIYRQSNRLKAIIEDLLTLANIEDEGPHNEISFNNENIYEILQQAEEVCISKLKDKNINLIINCPTNIKAEVNSHMIHLAFVNLIDNAIKYSNGNTNINIYVKDLGDVISVEVQDHGIGIPDKDLPRIFERFYRVDKARSRKLGGTGLGLSIVKHIACVHQGSVDVESKLGHGTKFYFNIKKQR